MPSFNCMQCGLQFANPNDYVGSKHACMANAKTIPVVDGKLQRPSNCDMCERALKSTDKAFFICNMCGISLNEKTFNRH